MISPESHSPKAFAFHWSKCRILLGEENIWTKFYTQTYFKKYSSVLL